MNLPMAALLLGMLAAGPKADPPRLEVIEIPGGGVQPQAVVDSEGVIHLVFLRGDPAASDVYYSRRKPGETSFEAPIRVNSEPGCAIAMGTVRGVRIALGRGSLVHVAWNGTQKAKPANPIAGSPLLYARSNEAKAGFEPQRNLMTATQGLDGGGSIAADSSGSVYVAWHGLARGLSGEANRRMWVARSKDDGRTFSAEEPASTDSTGACACCGTAALVGSQGSLYLLYRAATGGVERGMVLLTSRNGGKHFDAANLDAWRINACPMSTTSIVEGSRGVLTAWETKGQVSFARIDRESGVRTQEASPPGGTGSRKHPALAVNGRGEFLLVWAEGTGWQKGGSLAWQMFDESGRPIGPPGQVENGVPVWGLATVVARPDGGFTIIR
jgi:hypothetical protein